MAIDINVTNEIVEINETSQVVEINASSAIIEYDPVNLITNVRNQTGSTIAKFKVVYISGATGNKPLITLASNLTEAASSKTYGITRDQILNNGTGYVVTVGELRNVDTSAFNEGDQLWLGTSGNVITAPPAEPAHAVFIGFIIRSHPTLGVVDVRIQNGYELNELHGVEITSLTNGQVLKYDSATGLWVNGTDSSSNIYNSDGTIEADRTVSVGDKKLILRSTAPTNYTPNGSFGIPTNSNIGGTWPTTYARESTINYGNTSAVFPTINTERHWVRVTNTGNSGTYLNERYFSQTFENTGSGSYTGDFLQMGRGWSGDTNTTATNMTFTGAFYRVGHIAGTGDLSTTSAIVSSAATGGFFEISNRVGTITTASSLVSYYNITGNTISRNSSIGTYYGLRVWGYVGTSSTVTGTVTNFYGLHIDAPIVGATGTITNRWGVYAPDAQMKHHVQGNFILGGNVDAGFKLDVVGTGRFSDSLTLTTIASATTDTDKFLVSDGGVIKFRTGSELLSDIGAQASLTNPITGTGTSGQVAYFNGTTSLTSETNLFWDGTNDRLGINNSTPTTSLDVLGSSLFSANVTGSNNVLTIKNTNTSTAAFPTLALDTNGTQLDQAVDIRLGSTNPKGIRIYASNQPLTTSPAGAGFQFFANNSPSYPGQVYFDSGANNNAFISWRTAVTSGTVTERMRIFSDGNILIQNGGTYTNAGFLLDVNGTSRFQGNLRTNVTANSIVKTDANGILTAAVAGTDYQAALTNPITGTGASGQVAYWSGTNTQTGSSTFLFTPTSELDLANSVTASSAIARGSRIRPTLVAAANNDVLVGLDVNPTFTNGAFTGVSNLAARFIGNYVLYQNSAGNPGTGYAMEFATNSNLPRVDFVVNGLYVGQFSSNTSDVRFANNLNTTGGIIFNTKSGGTNTDKAKIFNNGNLLLQNGGTFTDSGQRLQVNGDTLMKGSGNTSATTALTVQNSTPTSILTLDNDGSLVLTKISASGNAINSLRSGTTDRFFRVTAGYRVLISSIDTADGALYVTQGVNNQSTSGNRQLSWFNVTFNPTSGTATHNNILIDSTINQTGGANGITRGLYVNPTLTAAADWRAIEAVSASNANHTLIKLRNATVDVFTVKSDSKIGFFNATPVAQATTGIAEATFVENSGGTAVNVDSTFAGYTLQQIAQALKDFGLLA